MIFHECNILHKRCWENVYAVFSVRVSIKAVIKKKKKTVTKSSLGREVFISVYSKIESGHTPPLREVKTGIQAGDLGARTKAGIIECCLLAWFRGFLGLLLNRAPTQLPRGGTTHSDPGPFTSITSRENVPQTCLHVNLTEALSRWSSSQTVSSWRKQTKWRQQQKTWIKYSAIRKQTCRNRTDTSSIVHLWGKT